MNANQKIHNATLSKWLDLFKDQVASGKSVKAWCADNGYSTYAYYYWKRAAKEAYLDSMSPDIVPIAAPELPSVASDEEVSCNSTTSLCNLRESRNLYNFSNTSPTETDHSRELYNSRNTEDITVCVGGISIKCCKSPDIRCYLGFLHTLWALSFFVNLILFEPSDPISIASIHRQFHHS